MSQRVHKVAETPLELFTANPDIQEPFINNIYAPTICCILGLTGHLFTNWALRRPLYSGASLYALWGGLGLVVGKYLGDRQNEYTAEYDAVMRHYISLHPDDFPPFKREKYSAVLGEWYPIR